MSKTVFLHKLQTAKTVSSFLLRFLFYFASVGYSSITYVRNKLYDVGIKKTNHLAAPIVSIGNITAGGTGKTPIVIWLLQNLSCKTRKPILLSRGYGGDEQKLLAMSLPGVPHYTNSKRFIAGQQAIKEYGKDVIFFLDDGFQHRQLHRDLNIVLIDATCPFGYDYVLPRGFLRESIIGLKRADIFILTRCNMVTEQELTQICDKLNTVTNSNKLKVFSRHTPHQFRCHNTGQVKSVISLQGKKAFVFCGIGNPQSFYHTIRKLRIEITEESTWDDHFQYDQEHLEVISRRAKASGADVIITTSKDAVKISSCQPDVPLWILDITITIDNGKDELLQQIQQFTSRKR